VDSGTVVGTMPTSDTELVESAHPGGHFAGTNGASHAVTNGATANMSGGRLRAAPAARALAKKLGIDLNRISGSGRGGVIIVDDIIAHSGSTAPQADLRNSDDSSGAPRIEPTAPLFSGGERLRGLRRAMAASMSVARDNVASCTIFDDADLHRWGTDQDVTTRLLRAIAVGAKAEPALNAWFDGAAQNRRVMSQIDVGIAVDTADGLIVPVIRNAGDRSSAELRQDIERMKRAARDRTAAPEDLRQATFMLTNFGMIAGRYATPVVVPPSVAILGAGRLTRDVVAVKDGMEAHLRMPLSLTFDHRCVTGGEAARFMAAVLRDLEKDN
jgi:pyruvate dehydrogenase E2 component (dihydrolipoamide acetyltransferase)